MLYLGIDQHKDQLTINLRNEQGEVVQKGQIKTVHADIDEVFKKIGKNHQCRHAWCRASREKPRAVVTKR